MVSMKLTIKLLKWPTAGKPMTLLKRMIEYPMSSFMYPWVISTFLVILPRGGFSIRYEDQMMSMASCWCSLYHLSVVSYDILINWSTLGRWKTLSMLSGHKSSTTSPVTLLTTHSLETKCCANVMINSVDCTDTGCEAAFTNPEWINEETRANLSVGLLHILRNSSKSLCLRSLSLISAWSSWTLILRVRLGT